MLGGQEAWGSPGGGREGGSGEVTLKLRREKQGEVCLQKRREVQKRCTGKGASRQKQTCSAMARLFHM